MGNQGTASDGLRRGVELIQAGVLGRGQGGPRLDQPPDLAAGPGRSRPARRRRRCRKHVHWDLWLGTGPGAPVQPRRYHPFNWRGWWDFGTGALGDMACHTANMPFMALKLGYPTAVRPRAGELNPETYPAWAHVAYEFPARGDMPPVKLTWYEGSKDGKLVLPPRGAAREGAEARARSSPSSGSILVGDKGILYSPNDYGGSYRSCCPQEHYRRLQGPRADAAAQRQGRRRGHEGRVGRGHQGRQAGDRMSQLRLRRPC